jgi:hypothetical protein
LRAGGVSRLVTLPPNVGRRTFDAALRAFAATVGEDWGFRSAPDLALYRDAYSPFRDSVTGASNQTDGFAAVISRDVVPSGARVFAMPRRDLVPDDAPGAASMSHSHGPPSGPGLLF